MQKTQIASRGNGLFAGRFLVCGMALLLAGALPASAAPVGAQASHASLDAAFDQTFSRYRLPGLALGVVVDGELVYQRTAGELAVGSGQPIDADSLFKIASNSKAMTAALLARLVDQDKLAWDDPVVKHLPDFRMHDEWVTQQMQVRDLLIHNSGLGPGAGDLMLWPEPNLFTRADVVHGLRHLKPIYSFRSRYAYDNLLYIVAGEVAAAAGGAPFDVLVRRELFEPLGMDRCQVGEWRRDEVGNVAQPHMPQDEGNIVIRADGEVVPDVPMMAAGGIRCSLNDMLTWARMWLQPERHGLDANGRPWLSDTQRAEVWKAHMPMPLSRQMREWDGSHFSAYGYGWRLTDVHGTWKVSHTGTLAGMYSALTLLPEKQVGFVVMINGEGGEARTVLTQALVAHFAAPDDQRHGVAHYADLLARQRDGVEREAGARVVGYAPVVVAEIRSVLGVYRDPWFGEAEVCVDDGRVRFRSAKSPKLTGTVKRAGERLLVDWDVVDVDVDAWLDFSPAQESVSAGLAMSRLDPDADSSYDYQDLAFERIGACPAH